MNHDLTILSYYRTLVSEKMRQYVALVNAIYALQSQSQVLITDRYPASTFTIFDVHALVSIEVSSPSTSLID